MVKLAILLLALTIAVSTLGARFLPKEIKRAAQILSYLLAAYVVVMVALGLIAYMSPS